MFSLARQHNWLIFSIINPAVKQRLMKYAKGKLVDIGCGEKPFKNEVKPYVEMHTGVDHQGSFHDKSNMDVFGTAYNIPLVSKSYDTVLCTDVLEHLEEPSLAISEAWRILKSGGYAIYTVPLFWHLHEEPRDYYRYTKYGLRYLFEKNGFDIVDISALSGFTVTFAQELVYFLYNYRKGGMINPLWWIIPPIGHLIQVVAYFMNKLEKTEMFTCEYIIVARKP
ncbi:MAG: class I SAM-dependent methyltransferase, partial [Chlorobium sp.]|nr:class I SAM-dependent methyltransferase [Chlorobium sp.]